MNGTGQMANEYVVVNGQKSRQMRGKYSFDRADVHSGPRERALICFRSLLVTYCVPRSFLRDIIYTPPSFLQLSPTRSLLRRNRRSPWAGASELPSNTRQRTRRDDRTHGRHTMSGTRRGLRPHVPRLERGMRTRVALRCRGAGAVSRAGRVANDSRRGVRAIAERLRLRRGRRVAGGGC